MSAVRVNGNWRQIDNIYVKINGVWTAHSEVYAKNEGAWQLIDLTAEALGPAVYIWRAYATDDIGTNISETPIHPNDDPANPIIRGYLGFSEPQRTKAVDLSDPSIFDWQKVVGDAATVTDNGDGTYTITGANGSFVYADESNVQPITITDNGDGTYTLDNGFGQTAVVNNPLKNVDYFDGNDGAYYTFIFRIETDESVPPTPTGGTFDGVNETFPDGWTDIPQFSGLGTEWRSRARYTHDSVNNVWTRTTDWSAPSISNQENAENSGTLEALLNFEIDLLDSGKLIREIRDDVDQIDLEKLTQLARDGLAQMDVKRVDYVSEKGLAAATTTSFALADEIEARAGEVTRIETKFDESIATIDETLTATATTTAAHVQSISSLNASVGDITANYATKVEVTADIDSAEVRAVNAATSNFGSALAGYATESFAIAAANGAESSVLTTIDARFDQNTGVYGQQIKTAVDAADAATLKSTQLAAGIYEADNTTLAASFINSVEAATATVDGETIAQIITDFTVSAGGQTHTIQDIASASIRDDGTGFKAQWGVSTDLNGLQHGVGFFANGGTTSFVVTANNFVIREPGTTNIADAPFIFSNGELFIDDAKIQSLDVSKLSGDITDAAIAPVAAEFNKFLSDSLPYTKIATIVVPSPPSDKLMSFRPFTVVSSGSQCEAWIETESNVRVGDSFSGSDQDGDVLMPEISWIHGAGYSTTYSVYARRINTAGTVAINRHKTKFVVHSMAISHNITLTSEY